MGYDREELIKAALEIIDKYPIRKPSELKPFLKEFGLCDKTFYNHKLHELHEISEKIEEQRLKRWALRIKRWNESGNPALEIAAAKLEASQDDLEVLTTTKVKQDLKVESFPTIQYQVLTNESQETTSE